jgi:hypothetical protein
MNASKIFDILNDGTHSGNEFGNPSQPADLSTETAIVTGQNLRKAKASEHWTRRYRIKPKGFG